jgi:hypothetical protein
VAHPDARLSEGATARALQSPPTVAAISTLLLNDQLLKGSGLLPSVITGKLSDLAFLFFGPIVFAHVARTRERSHVLAAFAVPAVLFAVINVSSVASESFAAVLSLILPSRHVCDAEDLVALAMLPVAWWYLWRESARTNALARCVVWSCYGRHTKRCDSASSALRQKSRKASYSAGAMRDFLSDSLDSTTTRPPSCVASIERSPYAVLSLVARGIRSTLAPDGSLRVRRSCDSERAPSTSSV